MALPPKELKGDYHIISEKNFLNFSNCQLCGLLAIFVQPLAQLLLKPLENILKIKEINRYRRLKPPFAPPPRLKRTWLTLAHGFFGLRIGN
jgi:hypothetical protein